MRSPTPHRSAKVKLRRCHVIHLNIRKTPVSGNAAPRVFGRKTIEVDFQSLKKARPSEAVRQFRHP
jgi:hypothetical protein